MEERSNDFAESNVNQDENSVGRHAASLQNYLTDSAAIQNVAVRILNDSADHRQRLQVLAEANLATASGARIAQHEQAVEDLQNAAADSGEIAGASLTSKNGAELEGIIAAVVARVVRDIGTGSTSA